jgi:hypothetical protein
MQSCPHCGRENADTDAYCYACGHILLSTLRQMTDATTRLEDAYQRLEPKRRWGTAYFDRESRLKFTFRDTGEAVLASLGKELLIGRAHDQETIPQPDVDLSPYSGMEHGVSRNHLMLTRDHDTIFVTDLGSANSTYLNGQRLMAHEPRILRDNDELRLGRLVMRVNFV